MTPTNNEETIIKDDGKTFIKVLKSKAVHKFFDKKVVTENFLKQLKGAPSKRKGGWSSSSTTSQVTDSTFLKGLRELNSTKPSEQRAITFDEKEWNVFYRNELLGAVKHDNREWYYFECLYIGYLEWSGRIPHTAIQEYVKNKTKSIDSSDADKFCGDIKRYLDKPINKRILTRKHHSILRELPIKP